MNLVGKIFVGIIAFMSVVCLTLSVVSYASHRNWKEQAAQYKEQIDALNQEKSALTAAKEELAVKLKAETNEYVGMVAALKTMSDGLEAEIQKIEAENKTLADEMATYVNAFNTNNSMINDARLNIETLTGQLADAQKSRAAYLYDLAQTMTKLHNFAVENGELQAQNSDLTDALDRSLVVLNQHGLAPNPEQYGDLPQFAVKGTIETVKQGAEGLLMITIGSDDGLNPGNKLDVSRGDSYLGKIEVVTVEPNRAVCKVLPEYRQGTMMEGDNVSSQFN